MHQLLTLQAKLQVLKEPLMFRFLVAERREEIKEDDPENDCFYNDPTFTQKLRYQNKLGLFHFQINLQHLSNFFTKASILLVHEDLNLFATLI